MRRRIGNYWLDSRSRRSLGGSGRPLPYQGTLEFPLSYLLCFGGADIVGFVGIRF